MEGAVELLGQIQREQCAQLQRHAGDAAEPPVEDDREQQPVEDGEEQKADGTGVQSLDGQEHPGRGAADGKEQQPVERTERTHSSALPNSQESASYSRSSKGSSLEPYPEHPVEPSWAGLGGREEDRSFSARVWQLRRCEASEVQFRDQGESCGRCGRATQLRRTISASAALACLEVCEWQGWCAITSEAVGRDGSSAETLYRRGRARFRLGDMRLAAEELDSVELQKWIENVRGEIAERQGSQTENSIRENCAVGKVERENVVEWRWPSLPGVHDKPKTCINSQVPRSVTVLEKSKWKPHLII